MQISLRPGERIYLNGAVVRVDRKVTLELLNDVSFLLEAHVLQVEEATTPLRQLYFVLQAILVDPQNASRARTMFEEMFNATLASFSNATAIAGLKTAAGLVGQGRTFDALRTIRALFQIEEEILTPRGDTPRAA